MHGMIKTSPSPACDLGDTATYTVYLLRLILLKSSPSVGDLVVWHFGHRIHSIPPIQRSTGGHGVNGVFGVREL
uniref:Uncharacterized protein n=2 Tax=Oryza TaxID=4527 RepID=A0A0E0MSK8_ORYRU